MFKIFNSLKLFNRNYSSALYVTGDKAQTNFVALVPYLDFEQRIEEKKELIENIQARKLNIDFEKLEKRWKFYKMIDSHKQVLEATKSEIGKMLAELKADPDKNRADIDKLLLHSKLVKDDLKNVKEYSYGIEENAVLSILQLPNFLHPKTPLHSINVIHEYLSKSEQDSESHLVIGLNKKLLELKNPYFYFLKSEAALFEFAILNYVQSQLFNFDYIQFSNTDFSRSLIVEGCGLNYIDISKSFILNEHDDKINSLNKLHLTGGGSLESFMAYFARNLIQSNYFPLKLFSSGRDYRPSKKSANLDLFNLCQESVVRIFVALPDNRKSCDGVFDEIIKEIINIYEPLGYHFRLVLLPANELSNSECLRLSIQMYSNHLYSYIEIGNVSIFGNYLSKRLLFTYNEDKARKFPIVISGQIVNVPRLLACVLENNNKENLLTDLINKYL